MHTSSSSDQASSSSVNQRQPGRAVALSPVLGLPQQMYTKLYTLSGSTPSSPATARSSPRLPPSTLKASVSEAADDSAPSSPAWGRGGMAAGRAAPGAAGQLALPVSSSSSRSAAGTGATGSGLHGIVEARNWVALDVEDSRPRGAPSSSSAAHGWRKAPVGRPSRSGAYSGAESDAVMCCLQFEWVKALVERSEGHPWACLALAACVLALLVFLCSL